MMTIKNHIKLILSVLFFGIVFLFLGCNPEQAEDPAPLASAGEAEMGVGPGRPVSAYHNKLLAEIRRATVHYKDVADAEAAGYVLSSECVSSPAGSMGYHYTNFALVDATVDPALPETLVYEPQKNGKLRLVAVEYIVVAEAWDAMHDSPPMLGEQVFDDFSEGGGGPPFPNYQLHAWVWKHNPSGMHAPFNPTVSCDYAL
ncbi:hypothetical protein [Pontibacter sp. HJ8]